MSGKKTVPVLGKAIAYGIRPELVREGDIVHLQIVGETQTYRAACSELGRGGPRFKVLDDLSWDNFTLKPGDYVLKAWESLEGTTYEERNVSANLQEV